MANLVHFHAAPEASPQDERVRMVAKRAVAELGFPFEGLHAGAAMILAQLGLSAGLAGGDRKSRAEN